MQNQPAARHAKLSEGACAAENAASLQCIEKNYTDKSKCAAHFKVYKACKQREYEAARAARIKAHSGGCGAVSPAPCPSASRAEHIVCRVQGLTAQASLAATPRVSAQRSRAHAFALRCCCTWPCCVGLLRGAALAL